MVIGYLNVLTFPFCFFKFILKKSFFTIQNPISIENKIIKNKLFQYKTVIGFLTFFNLILPFLFQFDLFKHSRSVHMSFLFELIFNLILVYFYLYHLIENNDVPKKLNWAIGTMVLGYVLMPIYYFKHIITTK